MQHNEEYVLRVLEDVGLVTRHQIDGARSRLNGEPGVVDILINDGVVSEVEVSRTLAAQAHMDWIDIFRDPFGNSYGYVARVPAAPFCETPTRQSHLTQTPYNFAENRNRELPFARMHHDFHTSIGALLFN